MRLVHDGYCEPRIETVAGRSGAPAVMQGTWHDLNNVEWEGS